MKNQAFDVYIEAQDDFDAPSYRNIKASRLKSQHIIKNDIWLFEHLNCSYLFTIKNRKFNHNNLHSSNNSYIYNIKKKNVYLTKNDEISKQIWQLEATLDYNSFYIKSFQTEQYLYLADLVDRSNKYYIFTWNGPKSDFSSEISIKKMTWKLLPDSAEL